MDGWNEFWKEYPRKVCKAAAMRAWAKAIKKADPSTITLSLQVQKCTVWKRHIDKKDYTYIPHASTWLNNERWEDEIDDTPIAPKRLACRMCGGPVNITRDGYAGGWCSSACKDMELYKEVSHGIRA